MNHRESNPEPLILEASVLTTTQTVLYQETEYSMDVN